ncbi:MAG: cytochrome c-type biosis protein CcmH [Solirubrobacterales bacterium]|jgi:cytochrome c-type biogenesis protein CcmH/NrfF|nr:cytochrome c-type biosis protein CcmH [Solirubrobacterales bacterium]
MRARRSLLFLGVLVAMVAPDGVALAVAAPPPRADLGDIEDEVMCTVCGTALNLSQAPQADRERALIRTLIAAGKTKPEIKAALVAEYGERVLAEPAKSGFDLTAWLVPLVALLLAAVGILTGVRRWRRQSGPEGPQPRMPDEEAELLDADLAKYEL